MLVDSHCHLNHLDLTPYQGNLAAAIEAAKANDVGYFLCVCIDLETFSDVLTIAEQYENVYATIGLHPNEQVSHEPTVDQLVQWSNHSKIIGIGETGLDYYRSQGDLTWQQNRFRHHIRAAKITKKPLIVHSREAREDTIRILTEEGADQIGGVMHCFTEDWEMAKAALDLNFYISFSGIVTFRNAIQIQDVAKKIPLDRMLVETDSPYLAPIPYRGKPNEPAYVRYVAEYIATLRGETYETIATQTTKNFFRLFRITGPAVIGAAPPQIFGHNDIYRAEYHELQQLITAGHRSLVNPHRVQEIPLRTQPEANAGLQHGQSGPLGHPLLANSPEFSDATLHITPNTNPAAVEEFTKYLADNELVLTPGARLEKSHTAQLERKMTPQFKPPGT